MSVPADSASGRTGGDDLAERVSRARARQADRQRRGLVRASDNAEASLNELERIAALDASSNRMLESAFLHLGLSARSYVRVLRVARTIADLDDSDRVSEAHVAEAICYRTVASEQRSPGPVVPSPFVASDHPKSADRSVTSQRPQTNGTESKKERKPT